MTTNFLTVAIPYVNADPHLGYAYELVLADVHARASRLDGAATCFLGGTDDYSLKNVLAAEGAGVPVRAFVDAHARRFESLRDPLNLSFDDFIRTSADERHIPAVRRLWAAAAENGDLYKRPYAGEYCIGCERFYTPDELDQGRCPEHLRPVERIEEENWFFRLSRYQQRLIDLIETDELRITPSPFRNEVLAFLRSGLDDISVSRSNERARGWGVPVPDDPSQVIYVWFDALTNYISALDYGDPSSERYRRWWVEADERCHVIGKGILRFHAVYWPAFLLSAGEPLPTDVRVHPYLTLGQLKLSKSTGTSVDPTHVTSPFRSAHDREGHRRSSRPHHSPPRGSGPAATDGRTCTSAARAAHRSARSRPRLPAARHRLVTGLHGSEGDNAQQLPPQEAREPDLLTPRVGMP